MAKQVLSIRLEQSTRNTIDRIADAYGHGGAAEVVADAVARLERWLGEAGRSAAARFSPAEWNLLADALNGTLWREGEPASGRWLALEVSDAHALNGAGLRWLLDGQPDPPAHAATPEQRDQADARAADLVARLAALSGPEAAAVAYAVRWFWAHADDARVTLDAPWWQPSWRESLSGHGPAPAEGGA